MRTATPASSADNTSSARRRRRVRGGVTATLLAVAGVTAASSAAHGAAAVPEGPVGCILTATADSLAFDITALVMTVRDNDGVVEILHDAFCLDGHTGTVWIAADRT